MRQFYELYSDSEFLSPIVAEIGWSHICNTGLLPELALQAWRFRLHPVPSLKQRGESLY
ncbi:MAG: hypothetical protein IPH04_06040 [Saprospirales bacterium]|nr:hypothetical protein [Saprospirales bacterium]